MVLKDIVNSSEDSSKRSFSAKKALAPAVALGSYLLPNHSDGALMTQYDPNIPEGSDYVFLNQRLINNDTGAIYDSGNLSSGILGDLGNQLLGLTANQHYGTIENLMSDWNVTIRSPPTGDVYDGWNKDVNTDGSVDFNHISGIPGLSYDQWSSTPGANTMALTVRIPLSQLELDGQSGYNPLTDARIELGTQTVPGAFTANTGSPAEGVNYNVIPEPATMTMIGIGCIAALAYRRLFGKR